MFTALKNRSAVPHKNAKGRFWTQLETTLNGTTLLLTCYYYVNSILYIKYEVLKPHFKVGGI